MLCPHMLSLSARDVPGGSSDTCPGLDLYLIDREHLLRWVPGHHWCHVRLCCSLLEQGQRMFIHHIHKLHALHIGASLLRAHNLGVCS